MGRKEKSLAGCGCPWSDKWFVTPRRSLSSPLFQVSLSGQENQTHNQMSASELKTSEMPFHSSIKTQDPKPEEKPPRKHKVPLTAAGMSLEW